MLLSSYRPYCVYGKKSVEDCEYLQFDTVTKKSTPHFPRPWCSSGLALNWFSYHLLTQPDPLPACMSGLRIELVKWAMSGIGWTSWWWREEKDDKYCGCCVMGSTIRRTDTDVSCKPNGQKMVFGKAGHFQTLIKIIYFVFLFSSHPLSTEHVIVIISSVLHCRRMIDMSDISTMIFT